MIWDPLIIDTHAKFDQGNAGFTESPEHSDATLSHLVGNSLPFGHPNGFSIHYYTLLACSTGVGAEDKVVPADVLLLGGTCIVEEAVLTGESTPQWKAAVQPPPTSDGGESLTNGGPEHRLDVARDRAHVLFGGTKVLQHTADKAARLRTPDGGCLAVVLRTGFETSQGEFKMQDCSPMND